MALDKLFPSAKPAVAVRGVHLDLKGTPPTFGRLMRLLELFAACRYNAVLVEWEDTFPWTVDARFRCETAYTPDQVRAFHARCGELHLAVIPLVQCLGHMETPLSVPGYERLREAPHQAGVLNPLADGARELVERMVDDVLALTPAARHFHLGGDEAWSFGTHPDTRAYVEKHGKGALYLRHVEPILDRLNARGIRPILWHDMMRDWEPQALRRLAAKADLCVWGYQGHPDTTTSHCNTRYIQRFAEHGVPMWGGTGYKGASGPDADLTRVDMHAANALAWVEVAQRFGMRGLFATAWSRYSTHNVQCETIDASLDSLLNVGVILHEGGVPNRDVSRLGSPSAPAGGEAALAAGLDELGERAIFEPCRDAARKLAQARDASWQAVRQTRQTIITATQDARRRQGNILTANLGHLRRAVAQAEAAGNELALALTGLVEPIWVERYVAERVEPLREELAELSARVRTLDPAGHAAIE